MLSSIFDTTRFVKTKEKLKKHITYTFQVGANTIENSCNDKTNLKPAKLWTVPGWDKVGIYSTRSQSDTNFCHPEPRPATPIVLVDISSYSYLK